MPGQRYSVNHYTIETLFTWIKIEEIAIPEIQRPFVWNATKVRDFIDSLYKGYPVGYLIAWKNPNVRLKDGTQSAGKRILIDGQQRVTALLAALLGNEVVNSNYKKERIAIAFHPGEHRFEVSNAANRRDPKWIPNIASIFAPNAWMGEFVDAYCAVNPDADKRQIDDALHQIQSIKNNSVGLIELNADLDVEDVAEIFTRINSMGVQLNEADFAMSKMAANEDHGGHLLRKTIDYFCHLAAEPQAYNDLAQDHEFASTDYFRAITWLKNEKDDLYDPSYSDVLRVAFTTKYARGRLAELVALLSGRDFATRAYDDVIAEETFGTMRDGILSFVNETNFKRFGMILRSAGFIESSLIRSQNTVNFAYILYLRLRAQEERPERIESLVRKWFVMSVLTGRYTNSPETAFGVDIRSVESEGVAAHLEAIERAELSDVFWTEGLPQQMVTSATNSPYFNVFRASHVKHNDKGFLSRDMTVQNLIEGQSNVHHIFPRKFLQDKGFKQGQYNQIANYVVMQTEINIAISDKPPETYFTELWEQCRTGVTRYGGITDVGQLRGNLEHHCIPGGMDTMGAESYDAFLQERRRLMATKIRDYYSTL